jgi:NADH:ubiquinone oxidoreductase subunit 4 (subunit M)
VDSRDILPAGADLATIAPLVAVIVALGIYPQFVLDRVDDTAKATISQPNAVAKR